MKALYVSSRARREAVAKSFSPADFRMRNPVGAALLVDEEAHSGKWISDHLIGRRKIEPSFSRLKVFLSATCPQKQQEYGQSSAHLPTIPIQGPLSTLS